MSYYNLFLDDERDPREVTWVELPPVNWDIVRDDRQFLQLLHDKGVPYRATFDHDLCEAHHIQRMGGKLLPSVYVPPNGYDLMTWLLARCRRLKVGRPIITIHTLNKDAMIKMKAALAWWDGENPNLTPANE